MGRGLKDAWQHCALYQEALIRH